MSNDFKEKVLELEEDIEKQPLPVKMAFSILKEVVINIREDNMMPSYSRNYIIEKWTALLSFLR